MELIQGLHFAEPAWLWALSLVFPLWFWLRRARISDYRDAWRRYAQPRLLPHLVIQKQPAEDQEQGVARTLWVWPLIWALGVLAMAGPRLGYEQVQLFKPRTNLVILLDISASMELADTPPSRLSRGKQEILDLMTLEPALNVGLVAFASVASVISPLTGDLETIRGNLMVVDSSLARLKGSRLMPALDKAETLVRHLAEQDPAAILLISDGDFDEQGLDERIAELRQGGIRLHVLGVGTPGGGPIPHPMGGWMVDAAGNMIESRLDQEGLGRLAGQGGGSYLQADFTDQDSRKLLEALLSSQVASQEGVGDDYLIWNERFVWLLLPMMLLVLGQFRRKL
jgi:Ca-activated chloride channel family protein